jgi:hypothetical protein
MEVILDILDISENSLKVITDNATVLDALSSTKEMIHAKLKLKDETMDLSCRFLREGQRYDKKAELVFLFTLDNNSKAILKRWLNDQQIKAINEIRAFKDDPSSFN